MVQALLKGRLGDLKGQTKKRIVSNVEVASVVVVTEELFKE